MNRIKGITILDNENKPIYVFRNGRQDLKHLGSEYLKNMMSVLEEFAVTYDSELNLIEMGDSKYLLTKDEFNNILFIIHYESKLPDDLANNLLDEVRNLYINTFFGKGTAPSLEKAHLMEDFSEDLKKTLEKKILDAGDFLKAI